jgi:hypothetical protein
LTHEKERSIAYLRLAVAEALADDNVLIKGFTSLLIPAGIASVLKVCLIADTGSRISAALEAGMTEGDALKAVWKGEEDSAAWVKNILDKNDPWDASLFDAILPTDKMSAGEIADLVEESLASDIFRRFAGRRKAAQDFLLASRIGTALVKEGYYSVDAEADGGAVTLTINKNVLRLKRLESELLSVVEGIAPVKSVATKVGRKFYCCPGLTDAGSFRRCPAGFV